MPEEDSCSIWQWHSMPPGSTRLARRVDGLGAAAEALGKRNDAPAPDADVGLEGVGRGGDRAAGNDEIEIGHAAPLLVLGSQTDLIMPPSQRIRLPVT